MGAKEFLLQECDNLKEVLEETLRYEYGIEGSREFYEECEVRLDYITQELRSTHANDHIQLVANCRLLEDLSALISRIERSSLGEYSWSFVEELKRIAVPVCAEATLKNSNSPPKIHVLSDGGLGAYSIFPEPNRPSASNKRILTIVFPRTLKHFVLLHSILGHEIGHAIWRNSKHQNRLRKIFNDTLINTGGKFSSANATADWIYDPAAPPEVVNYLATLGQVGVTKSNFFQWADWEAWKEEILCDLIGLLTFGPSFVAAHSQLLYALSPSGVGFGDEHPPVAARVNFILLGAKLLKYDSENLPIAPYNSIAVNFWVNLHSMAKTDPWYDLFDQSQLESALKEIGKLLNEYPPAHYQHPVSENITELVEQLLNKIPPIGHKVGADKLPRCYNVDFRHILYAGWIGTEHNSKIPFQKINRLCEHAIMQQRGIDLYLTGGSL
ncbi:MAG: hypothetical protein EPN55_06155 [Gammaproteobacteria bacterium]|nr:MAG: hypothetical protein EPN55_06155 [Gammaproteobacteria bacterium]